MRDRNPTRLPRVTLRSVRCAGTPAVWAPCQLRLGSRYYLQRWRWAESDVAAPAEFTIKLIPRSPAGRDVPPSATHALCLAVPVAATLLQGYMNTAEESA